MSHDHQMSSMNVSDAMGMDHTTCKMSMTWNWYTVGACFVSKSWHVDSSSMFAASCIAAVLLVIGLEFLHRIQRDYDALIRRQDQVSKDAQSSMSLEASMYSDSSDALLKSSAINTTTATSTLSSSVAPNQVSSTRPFRPEASKLLLRQFIRSLLHMLQFTLAYFIMLLAMSFNGYIIICIVIGAFIGPFIFSWDQILDTSSIQVDTKDGTSCCG